jgi:hypothetical protein
MRLGRSEDAVDDVDPKINHRQAMWSADVDVSIDPDSSRKTPYSHSIINEPSKLLICKPTDAAPQKFTVIFTVKVLGTSIGAGFRAIRPKVTFRDLSTSIESHNHFRSHRRTPV